MHEIVVLGLNHKSAPIEIREKLAFSKDEALSFLEQLQYSDIIKEMLVISTCNRVEIVAGIENKLYGVDAIKTLISKFKQLPLNQFENLLYIYSGNTAVRHVFRVASSLDSMMIGEPQILGQIKEAYKLSISKKSTGVILNRLIHRAFFVSKRVRTETGIGDHAVSISYAAVELARKIFGTVENKIVLLIGAGEMAEIAVEHLIRNKASDILVANRTFERGMELAQKFNGKAISFEEIDGALKFVDIIISSTASPDIIISRDKVKGAMRPRKNRPIFFIDIAVPRDIDPEINKIDNAYVYDIDDLSGIIEENIEERQKEAFKAERIIDEAVVNFSKWYESLAMVPTIIDLKNKIESLAQCELSKTLHSLKHLSNNDSQAITIMTRAIINKILHDPISFLKTDGCQIDKTVYTDLTRKLFKLDG
ncbi:MAG: glutamyl-tRNA reductase [Desulfobacterales bacterium]|nr:glutamyl-tRNA reductase [Desulfobacterales bacterium]